MLTRRDFLKYAGLTAFSPLLSRAGAAFGPGRYETLYFPEAGPAGLGRATTVGVGVYEKPEQGAARLSTLAYDDVVTIYAEVTGDALASHNDVWFQTLDGYVYSSNVQVVENSPQQPVKSVPEKGLLAEVSLPYVRSRHEPRIAAAGSYQLYYGTVYRVLTMEVDDAGQAWYGIADAGDFTVVRYAPAEALRIIRPEDLAPLSPGADKYIHVSLSKQLLEAYEGTRKVFETRVSSGVVLLVDGEPVDRRTSQGKLSILWKRPSSHMKGGVEGQSDYYDLLGVPFCSYFTKSAEAVHGAYWHNDFGRARSHGCLNVLPLHSRWVYRWVEPVIEYDAERVNADLDHPGTVIEIEE